MIQDGANPVPVDQIVPHADRNDIVWAGRFMARKAPHLAVQAFARAVPRIPGEVNLVMFGDGAMRPQVAALVRELGLGDRIDLRGYADRTLVARELGRAKALLFTSLRESFGGVVLEAAERGTPVVLARHSGIAGLTDQLPDGAAWGDGARSIRGMITALATGIVASITAHPDPWTSRSLAAYNFAARQDWNLRGQQMIDFYRALCS
jgi:glycosyltransferase involved in cell wall biosynthesis